MACTHQVASKIDYDLLALSNRGIASNLGVGLHRHDSFPLSVIKGSTNRLGKHGCRYNEMPVYDIKLFTF